VQILTEIRGLSGLRFGSRPSSPTATSDRPSPHRRAAPSRRSLPLAAHPAPGTQFTQITQFTRLTSTKVDVVTVVGGGVCRHSGGFRVSTFTASPSRPASAQPRSAHPLGTRFTSTKVQILAHMWLGRLHRDCRSPPRPAASLDALRPLGAQFLALLVQKCEH
jgi:hypothetical protein